RVAVSAPSPPDALPISRRLASTRFGTALPAPAPPAAPAAIATLRRPSLSVLRRASSLAATAPTMPPRTGPATLEPPSPEAVWIDTTVPQSKQRPEGGAGEVEP